MRKWSHCRTRKNPWSMLKLKRLSGKLRSGSSKSGERKRSIKFFLSFFKNWELSEDLSCGRRSAIEKHDCWRSSNTLKTLVQHSLINFHLLTCCRHSVSNRAPGGKKEEGFKTGRVLQFNGVQLRTARSFFLCSAIAHRAQLGAKNRWCCLF